MVQDIKKGDFLATLLRSSQTVFTTKEIALLWGKARDKATLERIHYYLRAGQLYSIRRGLYAKNKEYDRLEAATKIYTPSYVSFETVLARAGITFQFYSRILVASYLSRTLTADEQAYEYKKIKGAILTNHAGIDLGENYAIASPERAFLDILYLYPTYHFDNVHPLNWDRVFELLPIYGKNARMAKRVRDLRAGVTQP